MTKIEWTDVTWNPIAGCSVVSPGCKHCYAMTMARRLEAMGQSKYKGLTRRTKAGAIWSGTLRFDPSSLSVPQRWKRPRRIFVNSMSDMFHPDVPDAWIDEIVAAMAMARRHTFQVLTKRPARMRAYLTALKDRPIALGGDVSMRLAEPLPNVWWGTTAEDQRRADERVPELLNTPAAVRFVSAEPLLGPVDLRPWLSDDDGCESCDDGQEGAANHCQRNGIPREQQCPKRFAVFDYPEGPLDEDGCPSWVGEVRRTLDWVIVGGESGPGARPMHPDWARSLRDQCAEAGAAFLFKQWGEFLPIQEFSFAEIEAGQGLRHWDHDEKVHRVCSERGAIAFSRRISKRKAGRLLDGVLHDAYPETVNVGSAT